MVRQQFIVILLLLVGCTTPTTDGFYVVYEHCDAPFDSQTIQDYHAQLDIPLADVQVTRTDCPTYTAKTYEQFYAPLKEIGWSLR